LNIPFYRCNKWLFHGFSFVDFKKNRKIKVSVINWLRKGHGISDNSLKPRRLHPFKKWAAAIFYLFLLTGGFSVFIWKSFFSENADPDLIYFVNFIPVHTLTFGSAAIGILPGRYLKEFGEFYDMTKFQPSYAIAQAILWSFMPIFYLIFFENTLENCLKFGDSVLLVLIWIGAYCELKLLLTSSGETIN